MAITQAAATAWRQHFSANAGDLIQIMVWAYGQEGRAEQFNLQAFLLECFRRRRGSDKINLRTVERILQDLDDAWQEAK